MKSLTYYIKLIEAEERALDAFVYDRAVASFSRIFADFDASFPRAQKLGNVLQADIQKIMEDLVKTHNGGFLKRFFQSTPLVKIQIERDGTKIGGETGTSSKNVRIFLPYPVLLVAGENQEDFDEVCQLFAVTVVHEFVHVVQLLKKTYTKDQLNTSANKQGDFTSVLDDRYLSAPHELEAYAHTVAFDLIKILRNVPENMRSMMMNAVLNNRNLMASKSKSYDRYLTHASEATLNTLDGMISRLLHKHFD